MARVAWAWDLGQGPAPETVETVETAEITDAAPADNGEVEA
jgi:hypothetical protein